jgi:hypothetical protein
MCLGFVTLVPQLVSRHHRLVQVLKVVYSYSIANEDCFVWSKDALILTHHKREVEEESTDELIYH